MTRPFADVVAVVAPIEDPDGWGIIEQGGPIDALGIETLGTLLLVATLIIVFVTSVISWMRDDPNLRSPGEHTGVLFCVIDQFAALNDRWGATRADGVLHTVEGRIRDCLRTNDTVARTGGGEILILLPGVHNFDEVVTITDKIRRVVEEPITHRGKTTDVTLSVRGVLAPMPHPSTPGSRPNETHATTPTHQFDAAGIREMTEPI